MSSADKDKKRLNVDESPSKKEAKKVKTQAEETKTKITDSELFNMEVEESKLRDKAADLMTFKNTVAAVKESLNVIRALKKGKDATATAEICEQRIFTSLAIARLRKLNRLSHIGSARSKDITSEKRSKSDQHHLRLQNLLYEVGHLQKEINKCLEFRSKDEELNLVSVDSFLSEAPAEISRPEITNSDAHELKKARLHWELEQRKMLAKQLTEAKEKIEKSQSDIQTRDANLESLAPKLYKILEATRPVQDYLGMPFEQNKEQMQLAKYLPQPLFILFRNLNALQSQDSKGNLEVSIDGDVDSAKTYAMQVTAKDDESDSDQEEEIHKVSKHRRRTTSHQEDEETRVMKRHPLYLNLRLQCNRTGHKIFGSGVKVQLYFYHITTMNVVTVKGDPIQGTPDTSIAMCDLLQTDTILSCLYSGDKGDTCPSSFSQSQLEKLTPSNIGYYRSKMGTPFQWVQRICGLDVLNAEVTEPKLTSVSSVLKKIKSFLLDRVELVHQITELERCNLAVPAMSREILPGLLPTTSLQYWSRCTFEDLCTLPHAADYVDSGAITSDSITFLAKLSCASTKILVHLSISGDYPATRPTVLLRLEDNKMGALTRLNSDAIRCIEREVNIGKVEETEDIPNQLNLQLIRLAWCCDVFIAVNLLGTPQQNSVNIKFIPNCHRGRDRQLPLTYNPTTGFFGHD